MSPASKERGVEDGVMSVFLLLLGVVTTAAGLALVASAATTDTDIITPGTIAAVGGLLLVGMGLVVRELQRIEQALRPSHSGDAPAVAAAEPPARIPFPPKPKTNSQPEPLVADTTPSSPAAQPVPADPPSPPAAPSPAAPPAPAAAEDGAFERLRAKFPTLARHENGSVVDRPEVPVATQPPTPVEGNAGEVKKAPAVAGGRTNGAAPARAAPRDTKTRPAAPDRAKTSVFNAFWPAAPRRDAPTAPTHVAAPAPPPSEPAAVRGTAHDSSPAAGDAAAPVSALKSGVVEGMAYTLYSDGSIEAQLPQGKLRFGSITALRNHIERGV
jgi:hypothetical protein